jgi:L-fuculose-phosphate aldolase
MCEIGRRMYARNLVAATDGNISVRIGEGRYLVTPSGSACGFMHSHEMVIAGAKGEKISGEGRVSSEFFTHLAVYDQRPDIQAIVHAHPPITVAYTLAGLSMTDLALPEVVFAVGGIPTAPYATPGTREGADAVRALAGQCDALLMDRHGALTMGLSLMDAYYKMEKIEHAATTLMAARSLGKIRTLTSDEMARIMKARESYGATGKVYLPA